jgi:hypothetical protein
MNLPEVTNSDYIAANDYEAGAVWPPLKILSVEKRKAPNGKGEKAAITLEKLPKPWLCTSNEVLREIGAALGRKNIDKAWPGNSIALKIVPNIKRPDGTRGNAFRVAAIVKAAESVSATTTTKEQTA